MMYLVCALCQNDLVFFFWEIHLGYSSDKAMIFDFVNQWVDRATFLKSRRARCCSSALWAKSKCTGTLTCDSVKFWWMITVLSMMMHCSIVFFHIILYPLMVSLRFVLILLKCGTRVTIVNTNTVRIQFKVLTTLPFLFLWFLFSQNNIWKSKMCTRWRIYISIQLKV